MNKIIIRIRTYGNAMKHLGETEALLGTQRPEDKAMMLRQAHDDVKKSKKALMAAIESAK